VAERNPNAITFLVIKGFENSGKRLGQARYNFLALNVTETRPGVAKRFDPGFEFAIAWSLVGRTQCD